MTITRARLRRRTAQTTPLLLALLLPAPAAAATYQALCGNNPCTITLDMNGIGGQNTFIPIDRIAKWYTGGEEGYDSTNGTVGAVGGARPAPSPAGSCSDRSGWWAAWSAAPWPAPRRARRRISTSAWWATTAPATRPPSTSAS